MFPLWLNSKSLGSALISERGKSADLQCLDSCPEVLISAERGPFRPLLYALSAL